MRISNWIVFVALGDSLTVGFQSPVCYGGVRYIPYTEFLEAKVRSKLQASSEINVDFVNFGMNGDSTDGMLARYDYLVPEQNPDFVIIWGGINDLSAGKTPKQVFNNLKKLYEKTEKISSTPISCTLTPVSGSRFLNERIRELNQLVSKYCIDNKIPLADLYTATLDKNGVLQSKYSNDGVHLTREGYMVVAETLFDEVIDNLLDKF